MLIDLPHCIRPLLPEELFGMQCMPLPDLFSGGWGEIFALFEEAHVGLHDVSRITGMSFNLSSAIIACVAMFAALDDDSVQHLVRDLG